MDVGDITSNLSNRSISVTCFNESLNCLVLVHFRNNPDRVLVSHINVSDVNRTTVIELTAEEETNISVVAVYTWNNNSTGSIFSGQLSHVSQFEPPPSTSECLFCETVLLQMC